MSSRKQKRILLSALFHIYKLQWDAMSGTSTTKDPHLIKATPKLRVSAGIECFKVTVALLGRLQSIGYKPLKNSIKILHRFALWHTALR